MPQVKYWVKMKIMVGTDSFIMRCEHLGEAKLYGYMLATFNQSDSTWSMSPEKLGAIKSVVGIEKATVYKYLKNLVKNGLLLKKGRGHYKISEEFIEYGATKNAV